MNLLKALPFPTRVLKIKSALITVICGRAYIHIKQAPSFLNLLPSANYVSIIFRIQYVLLSTQVAVAVNAT